MTHFNLSTYTAFDNNPIYWADPSGADATATVLNIFNASSDGMTWYNIGNGGFSTKKPKKGETKKEKDIDPKILIYAFDMEPLEDIDRLSLVDYSGDIEAISILMKFYPYHDLSDDEIRAELASLIMSIVTAGLGNSSRFSKVGDLASTASDASGISSLQILPMTKFISEKSGLDRLFHFEQSRDAGPWGLADYVDDTNLVLIFSDENLFQKNKYNETSNINKIDYNEVGNTIAGSDDHNVKYMYVGAITGNGVISVINTTKLKN